MKVCLVSYLLLNFYTVVILTFFKQVYGHSVVAIVILEHAGRSQTSVVPHIENVIGGNSVEIQKNSEILLLHATMQTSNKVKSSYI